MTTINFGNINLFRLRGGWLGTGIVILEVNSPDGNWVVMHTYRNPNTLTTAYAYTTNWNYIIDLQNAANTSALTMYTASAGFGSTDNTFRITDPITSTANVDTVRSVGFAQYTNAYTSAASGNYGPNQMDVFGNLLTAQTSSVDNSRNNAQMLDLLTRILSQLKLLNIMFAANMNMPNVIGQDDSFLSSLEI